MFLKKYLTNGKKKDKENLIDTMMMQYDYITINYCKDNDADIKVYLDNCKAEILKVAKKLEGDKLVEEILEREKQIKLQLDEK